MGARAAGFSAEARVARVEVVHQGQEVTDQCHPVHGLLGRQAQQPEALPCGAGVGEAPELEGEANVRGRGGGHRDLGIMKKLSEPYGTEMSIEDGIGAVKVWTLLLLCVLLFIHFSHC